MKVFLVILLVISVIGNIYFVIRNKEVVTVKKLPETEVKLIQKIAIDCGLSPNQAKNISVKELLADIEIRLSNDYIYQGEVLSKKDLETLSIALKFDTEILNKIKMQNTYLSSLKDKKVIVFQKGKNDEGNIKGDHK